MLHLPLKIVIVAMLVAGCGPPAKADRCSYAGDFSGSTGCVMSEASWISETNSSSLTIESDPGAGQPLIKVLLRFDGIPQVGRQALPPVPILSAEGVPEEAGCNVWFFGQVIPFDNTRNSATYGGDPAASCSLRLEEVAELTSDADPARSFVVHGTLQARISGGESRLSPATKHADLFAGF